jgi:hypothetical protein
MFVWKSQSFACWLYCIFLWLHISWLNCVTSKRFIWRSSWSRRGPNPIVNFVHQTSQKWQITSMRYPINKFLCLSWTTYHELVSTHSSFVEWNFGDIDEYVDVVVHCSTKSSETTKYSHHAFHWRCFCTYSTNAMTCISIHHILHDLFECTLWSKNHQHVFQTLV